MADMAGQVALVTGGVRGIGLAISRRLAERGVAIAVGYSRDKEAAEQFCQKFGARRQGQAIPLIVLHGDADSTVHPVNAERLLDSRADARFRGAPTVDQGTVAGGRAYTRSRYGPVGEADHTELWTIHGGGHGWSGGSHGGSYTDPTGPDASAELVRFFAQHPKPVTG